MAESTFTGLVIPKYEGNYERWSLIMENLLRSMEYWDVVEKGVGSDTSNAEVYKARQLTDMKAKNILFQSIDWTTLNSILSKDTAKEIWDSMKAKSIGTERVKRAHLQVLRREFDLLQMKEGEKSLAYCSRVLAVCNKMRFYGETVKDLAIVEKILRSLSPKFDYIARAIEESNDINTMTIDELQSSLIVHEHKLNRNSVRNRH